MKSDKTKQKTARTRRNKVEYRPERPADARKRQKRPEDGSLRETAQPSRNLHKTKQRQTEQTPSAPKGGTAMEDIPDDPIIRSLEETGYPPWYR
jgi:hypothetical protein